MEYFCPLCFERLSPNDAFCPACGGDVGAWSRRHSYSERLINALRHPISEVRMGAIITLGKRRNAVAALPLARCALAYPSDLVQNLEIVHSIKALPPSAEREAALALLAAHPARAVRAGAALE